MRKQLLILAAACVAVTAMGANPVQGRLENVKRLTSQTDLKFENPQFSPDGKQIAFTKLGYEGIYVMNADGANMRSISNAMGVGYMYQWSPDSRQILALEASSDRTKTLAPTLHAVVTLDRGRRFGLFNEVDLMFQTGASRFKRTIGGELRDTRTNITQASLNFSPGVCCFLQENLAFNISFGVFGLRWRHEKQTTNGEFNGSRSSSGANFRFNIFNINFGLMVVI